MSELKVVLEQERFTRAVNTYAKLLDEEIAPLFVKKVAFQVLERVVMRTPVDFGVLRGGWQLTIGQPAYSNDGVPDKTGTETAAKGWVALQDYKLGKAVWISNPVEYAGYVEFGTERTRPVYMLYRSLREVRTPIMEGLRRMR